MNFEAIPSSSSTPVDGQTLGESREKSPCDVTVCSVLPKAIYSTPQDQNDDTNQSIACSPRQRRGIKYIEQVKKMTRSLTLENSGSVARDHLASERTFLAYVRTSIGCSTMGVALVQLFSMTTTPSSPRTRMVGNVLGAIVTIIGMAVLIMGSTRYFHIQSALTDGKYMTAGYIVLFIALFIAATIIVMFGVLIGVAVVQ